MLIYKTGDILKCRKNIICHQVNEDGVMGGGLALQIATKYPRVKDMYRRFCNYHKYKIENLLGESISVRINDNKVIANCFTQVNFVTNLMAIDYCFSDLLKKAKNDNLSVAIPYKYGCGIAKGDWKQVEEKFRRLSKEFGIDIYVYRLEEER